MAKRSRRLRQAAASAAGLASSSGAAAAAASAAASAMASSGAAAAAASAAATPGTASAMASSGAAAAAGAAATPGTRLSIEMLTQHTLTKEQIDLQLQELKHITAQAATDCCELTSQLSLVKLDEKLTNEEKDAQILRIAKLVESAKERVSRFGGWLMARILVTQDAMKLQGRDAGELNALETALEQATQTAHAFFAGLRD